MATNFRRGAIHERTLRRIVRCLPLNKQIIPQISLASSLRFRLPISPRAHFRRQKHNGRLFGGTMKKLFVCLTFSILLVTAYSEAQLSNGAAVSWLEDQPSVAKVERSGWVAGAVDIHVNNAWDAMSKYEKELLVNN